jgi:hypothetical protein
MECLHTSSKYFGWIIFTAELSLTQLQAIKAFVYDLGDVPTKRRALSATLR